MHKIALTSIAAGGLVLITAAAAGQQQAEQLYEPTECAMARDLAAAGRAREAAEWQRICVAKRRDTPPVAPARWVDELPTIMSVKAAFREPARQEAAFGVLMNYIEQLTGHNLMSLEKMPPAARTRWSEYRDEVDNFEFQRSHVRLGNAAVAGPARAYFLRPAFKTEVLSKWASSRPMAGELGEANRGHVDLGIFGIRLGEPLQLPSCADDASENCISVHDANMLSFVGQLAAASRASLSGVATGAPVKLSRSKCPSWLWECVVYVDIRNNIPIGAFAYTAARSNDDLHAVEKALNEKYGHHMTVTDRAHTCENTLTGIVTSEANDRQWRVPPLQVTYSPIMNCQVKQGVLTVKFRSVVDEAERKHEQSEPKM